jgi:predicted RND superfamily exporter protein
MKIIFLSAILFFVFCGTGAKDLGALSEEEQKIFNEVQSYAGYVSKNKTGSIDILISDKTSNKKKIVADDVAFEKLMLFKDRITFLQISSNLMTAKSYKKIGEFTRLKELVFSDAKNFDDDCAPMLRKLVDLERFAVTGDDVKDIKITGKTLKEISGLKKLNEVCIESNYILDDDIEYLADLPNLVSLVVTGSGIADKGIEMLAAQNHPNLKKLDLSRTNLTDKGMDYLKKIKSLNSLYVIGTKVTEKKKREVEKAIRSSVGADPNFLVVSQPIGEGKIQK